MHASIGVGQSIALLLVVMLVISYGWGWWQLRHAIPRLATRWRVVPFVVAVIALSLALVWPLPGWSNYLLAMRSLQKALLVMVAAPMLWLAAPVHVVAWGLRGHARGSKPVRHAAVAILRRLTQPMVSWFVYITLFLFWHDPTFAQFQLGPNWLHTMAPWLIFGAALLLWWPVVNTGPRFHRTFPAWLLIVYLISIEVLNMVAGVSIAFADHPLYHHYLLVRAQLAPGALPWSQVTDQMMGGAIIWVFGSLVYIYSIVFVLFDLFRKEGSTAPLHLPDWDDYDKFIAPGLEHRATQNKFREANLHHH